MSYFERMSPESQGIDSACIVDFIEEMDRKGLELHRLMIIRHGVCVAKGCYAPYEEEDLHPVYSFTKSLTSTAIGFAVQEGLLHLDDRLVDIFPEYVPTEEELPSQEALEHLKRVTIHHLLTMSCGQEEELADWDENWIAGFMRQPCLHEPGTFFKYNTAGTNMLVAILKRVSGQDLTEYLKERLFQPIGMAEDIFCYDLPDPMHTQMGGGGMKLTLEDMARFTYFMLHDGHWEGKAILPGWYSVMGRKQIETEGDSEGHIKDWAQGYGYQCWMCIPEGSYRADGAFGQFGLVFPDKDLIVITNAATEQTQSIMDAVNEILLPGVGEETMEENSFRKQHRLDYILKNLRIPALKGCHNPTMEAELEGKVYRAQGDCSGIETLIGGAGLRYCDQASRTKEMSFHFTDRTLTWIVKEENRTYEIPASLEHEFLRSPLFDEDILCAASARWRSLHALEIELRRMDAMSGVRLIFRFEGEQLHMDADETLMTDGGLGMSEKKMCSFAR